MSPNFTPGYWCKNLVNDGQTSQKCSGTPLWGTHRGRAACQGSTSGGYPRGWAPPSWMRTLKNFGTPRPWWGSVEVVQGVKVPLLALDGDVELADNLDGELLLHEDWKRRDNFIRWAGTWPYFGPRLSSFVHNRWYDVFSVFSQSSILTLAVVW